MRRSVVIAALAILVLLGCMLLVGFYWGTGSSSESIPPQGDARGVQYTHYNQGADVIRYTIEDGGHTWLGGMPIPIVGKTSKAIDATEEMRRFFQAYERDVQP